MTTILSDMTHTRVVFRVILYIHESFFSGFGTDNPHWAVDEKMEFLSMKRK